MSKCKVCSRSAIENEFCSMHLKAYTNILEKLKVWRSSSDVSWAVYLVEIQKNSLTGEWAKDVATYLIEVEDKHVQKSQQKNA